MSPVLLEYGAKAVSCWQHEQNYNFSQLTCTALAGWLIAHAMEKHFILFFNQWHDAGLGLRTVRECRSGSEGRRV